MQKTYQNKNCLCQHKTWQKIQKNLPIKKTFICIFRDRLGCIVPSLAISGHVVCTHNECFTSVYYIDRKHVIKFANRYLCN